MSNQCTVIDSAGTNLFTIDFIPQVGHTFSFNVEYDIESMRGAYAEHYIEHVMKLHKMNLRVIGVHTDMRQFDSRLSAVTFVLVEQIEKDELLESSFEIYGENQEGIEIEKKA